MNSMMIFLVGAVVLLASVEGGVVPVAAPLAYTVPVGSSFTAHSVNHAIAAPVAAAPLAYTASVAAPLAYTAPLAAPLAYAAHPAAYPYAAYPSAYSAYPSAYSAHPAAYSAYPAAYSAHPAAYSAYPAAYSALPAVVG